MPYISPEQRAPLEEYIQPLADRIHTRGELNYVITRLIMDRLGEPTYSKLEQAMGVLECAKQELYRKVAGKYEDMKCVENGEVY